MDKRFWLTISLSIATVWGIQWYFGKNIPQGDGSSAGPIQVGGALSMPQKPSKVMNAQDFYRPLNTTVVFDQEQQAVDIHQVETPLAQVAFTNQGGAISRFAFKKHKGKNGELLSSVNDYGFLSQEAKMKTCFLLALDETTPFVYTFEQELRDANKGTVSVVYKAETADWILKKTYTLYDASYQVDLGIALEPKKDDVKPVRVRLFVPSPWVQEVTENVHGLFALDASKNKLEKTDLDKAVGIAWPWNVERPLFGLEDKYFAHALVGDKDLFVQRSFIRDLKVVPQKVGDVGSREVFSIFESGLHDAAGAWTLSFYMGPKTVQDLVAVDDRLDDLMSFGWLSWLCKLLLTLLEWLYAYFGNYGIAIILLALALRLPLSPLSIQSRRKMELYQKFSPTIQKIRNKYKHDLKQQQEELMRFHRDHNLSPSTPIFGCLPMLIQLPILFALFRVLGNHVNLYNAPFYGWVIDLSSKDPYYILPVLMGGSMIWQQLMTPSTDDKQRVLMVFMSIVFMVFFAKAAAGLVIYWLINNVVTLGEDYLRRALYR